MPLDRALVQRLHGRARASRWGLPLDDFASALETSVAHAFASSTPSPEELSAYCESLRVEDLALATACRAGIDAAWDCFIRDHRPALYRAADAIDRTGNARELADGLYADLFGLRERDGVRQSLFRYFHGRSSLGSWVRAVLAQRHVDRLRAGRRLDPLPDDEGPSALAGVPSRASVDPRQQEFQAVMASALAEAVAQLPARDRLRLGCYYAQNMKLAAIGRMLGEHEASVSRHLARARRDIREHVEARLRDRHGYDAAAIAECFRSVVDDSGGLDITTIIPLAAGKKPLADRS